MSLETLNALWTSTLLLMKALEGVGQSHQANGRQTTLASLKDLTENLTNIEAAIEWKNNSANRGNNGYARRFASFGGC